MEVSAVDITGTPCEEAVTPEGSGTKAAQHDLIEVNLEIRDGVGAFALAKHEFVEARFGLVLVIASEGVVADATHQHVVALTTADGVVAAAAFDGIVAG